ncbi:MAG: TPM domain-containing protein [Calditrichia bacterium]
MLQSLLKFCFKYFTAILSLILLGILWSDLPAQTLPEKPREWVNDYAGILNNQEKQSLNSTLRAYEDTTSNQIVVAIFQNARGYPVEDYSIRLAEKWQVGQKGKDNGVILAIFLDEHKIRVEVGYESITRVCVRVSLL